ncbi:MAG: hypothetical protein M1814_002021 [Vezdaea aestivalis]|nr:MAG: hypothetical protein M1814_002021 [Vezdaea aestivalis]
MENFGSSCYCNSILQSLYYSVPFREQILRYPIRSSPESIRVAQREAETERKQINQLPPTSPLQPKPKTPLMSPAAAAMSRKTPAGSLSGGQTRPEDIKDSPEWKKKHALINGPVLHMDYENSSSYNMPESLYTGLKDIFEAIAAHGTRTGIISPLKFMEILKRENESFRGPTHQDAHEFLNLLLNEVVSSVESDAKRNGQALEEKAKAFEGPNGNSKVTSPELSSISTPGTMTPKGLSWLHDLFEGTLTSETRCLSCENISQRDEIFLDLSVDLEEHSSVTACLRKFSEEEMLCERNKFHCDNCGGLQEAEKRMKIKRLPRILALHLKRFKYTEDLQRLQKLFHRVVYPYHLRLFNTTDDADDPDRLYELYAVVVHIGGGPYHGHYVSIVKTEDRGWLLFDDELVEPVKKSYVRNFFGDRPGLACAYLLFYQETTTDAVQREQEAEGKPLAEQIPSQHKEIPIAAAQNGTVPNGVLHTVMTARHSLEADKHLGGVDKSQAAPSQAPVSTVVAPNIPPVDDGEAALSKKEKARLDKEAKIAEKQRLKEQEAQRKEAEKQQREQARAAPGATKPSTADEERLNTQAPESTRRENGPSSGGVMHNSLNRFKQGSKSINKRMFGLRSSEDASYSSIPASESLTRAFLPPKVIEEQRADNIVHQMDKAEKTKSHRFSLKKKPSTNL